MRRLVRSTLFWVVGVELGRLVGMALGWVLWWRDVGRAERAKIRPT